MDYIVRSGHVRDHEFKQTATQSLQIEYSIFSLSHKFVEIN